MPANGDNRPIIVKRFRETPVAPHHGGAWKIAYADFVTAMMAFFLLMWLLNATTEQQRKGLADYFDPSVPISSISAGGAGLAGRIGLNAAVDPATGGAPSRLRDGIGAVAPGPAIDGTLPRALLDALTARTSVTPAPGLSPALSFSESVAGVIELAAIDRVSAESETAAFSGARETLAAAEAGAVGVDSDAELQAMIQIEQAYAANAQVIQTAARMLDQLMET